MVLLSYIQNIKSDIKRKIEADFRPIYYSNRVSNVGNPTNPSYMLVTLSMHL